jgi:hypothetical protein
VTLETAYAAWKTDRMAGEQSLLIAADNDTVTELNRRAHHDLAAGGHVASRGVLLAAGNAAAAGDHIITRRVDRHLADGTTETRRLPSGPGSANRCDCTTCRTSVSTAPT